MTDRAYPLPRPESGNDPRFTFGLTLDVARLLEAAGYPPVDAGGDFVDLQLALFRFIYQPEADSTHNVMVDAAGVCPQCPVDSAEQVLLAELRLVHAPELHLDVQVCTFCSEKQEAPVRWPCSDLRHAEVELGGPEARAKVRRTHFGRKDPEHGRVCAGCSDREGMPVLWPCLLLRAVDRIEDVLHADETRVKTDTAEENGLCDDDPEQAPATDEIHADADEYDFGDGEARDCPNCEGRHRPPWCADLSIRDDLTESTTTEPPGDAS